ncbi:hypothetical protein OAL37_01990 [Pelagibacteraceae bacterium]|jgi:predicted dehydrogenase|nr:hypothetical protein [Pelagibacteraceae bacterium]
MVKKILIIGRGSISSKHILALRLISKKFEIINISSRKFNNNYAKQNFFDVIVICSPSSFHYKHMQIVEQNFNDIKVLIEKPLFDKFYKIKVKMKNKYFVGYNLRFHPVINYLKKKVSNKKIFSINIISHSFLPSWRKKNYTRSVSARKKLGGGILLELSHELDYLRWIFKNISILNIFNKKISNLKINTDDILNISGKIGKKTFFNLNSNFFSKINNRSIKIDGINFSISANLIKNKIEVNSGQKRVIKKFPKFNILNTYKDQYLDIFSNKNKNVCTLKQGLKLMNLIQEIKNYD